MVIGSHKLAKKDCAMELLDLLRNSRLVAPHRSQLALDALTKKIKNHLETNLLPNHKTQAVS